jgi:hypothetical protein
MLERSSPEFKRRRRACRLRKPQRPVHLTYLKTISQLVVIVSIQTCSTSLTRVRNWNDGQHQRQLKCVNVACNIMLATFKTLAYCGCRMRG